MTIRQWLHLAQEALNSSDIETARLDALVLLEDTTSRDRAWLLAHDDESLLANQLRALADNLERRLQHEPLAYIRGQQEFYGRRFAVTPDVLVPRPESETMIELLKRLAVPNSRVADIGTGCGALAITAALETDAVVAAVDIDEACLAVAERNAVMHSASVQLLQSDLLSGLVDFAPSVLLANLPYVPTDYLINEAARHEPALALFGGDDGLDLYRRMFKQSKTQPIKLIFTEALPMQHRDLVKIAESSGYNLIDSEDFIQVFKR